MFLKSKILFFLYFTSFGSSSNSNNEDESSKLVQVPKELFERLIDKHEELIRLIEEDGIAGGEEEEEEAENSLPSRQDFHQDIKAKKLKFLKRVENRVKRSGKKLVNVFSKVGEHISKAGAHISDFRRFGRGIAKIFPKILHLI